jgi:hypothetical protein
MGVIHKPDPMNRQWTLTFGYFPDHYESPELLVSTIEVALECQASAVAGVAALFAEEAIHDIAVHARDQGWSEVDWFWSCEPFTPKLEVAT